MSLFNSKPIIAKRASAGEWVKGRWVEGSNPSTFSISGSIQPTTGDKLQTLLEGKRIQGIIEIITGTELQATDPITQTTGDIVTSSIDGLDYEVIQVLSWQNGILPHYECIAIREKEGN